MSRVEDIEAAIERLPLADYHRFVAWFREKEETRWDAQLDADSATGKLDFLFEEAEREASQGQLVEWPSER
jgi:hypothetical protein